MLYIYKILSRNNSKVRISFYLPWIGLLIGTIFLILVDSIMNGMEDEIFLKLSKVDNGYKMYPDSKKEKQKLQEFLETNNVSYYSQKIREVLVGESDNYIFAKLITRNQDNDSPFLSIGKGISTKLHAFKGDQIRILSPLDAKLTTMKFPIKTAQVTDVYTVPVIGFDDLYIISNDIVFSDKLSASEYLVIEKNINNDKLSLIKDNFPHIKLYSWIEDYSTLVNAIRLEKQMYTTFAFLLIVISSLGLFTTMNYTITNKASSILSIYYLGYRFEKIKKNAYKLMLLLTLLFTLIGVALTSIFLKFHVLDPLLDILFPKDIFYNFTLSINYIDIFLILLLNIVVILFSVFIPFKSIHSSINRRAN